MNNRPTPETDAQGYGDGRHPYVATDFARRLERERDEARERLAQLWIPITDAPLSSPCLVTDGERVEKARWMLRKREWVFPHAKLRLEPTHWMPLPDPRNVDVEAHQK